MALDFSSTPRGFVPPPGFHGRHAPAKRREFDKLKGELLSRALSVCQMLYPLGKRINGEWRVGSPSGEAGKSMGINLSTGWWKDFDGGEGGGDLISLWARCLGMSQHEAYDDAMQWCGLGDRPAVAPVPPKPPAKPPAEPASERDDMWWQRAPASKKWNYTRADGSLFAIVCRFDHPDGGPKEIRPWDPARSDWKVPEGPRPLYNLDGILKSPGPVVLVEGEKCADKLIALGWVATTILGGASAASKADWTPLKGRAVIRWPDNDHPQLKDDGTPKEVAREVWLRMTREQLTAVGSGAVRDVTLPDGKPDGWDCADATDDECRALLGAVDSLPPSIEVRARQAIIAPKPLSLPDFSRIPKRYFIYGHTYQRRTVTVTAGEGGGGKSALHIVEGLSVATGRDLLGTGMPIERCPVWFISLEDDEDEIHRRIAAVMLRHGIDRQEIDGWLYVTTRADAPEFLLARRSRNGAEVISEAVDDLKNGITKRGVGLVIVDPYVYTHALSENDNSEQAMLMNAIAGIAMVCNVSIGLVHHAKKPDAGNRGAPSAGDSRGASAIVNGARHGRMVNPMTSAEASQLGIPEERRSSYFRATSVKANYSRKASGGHWYKFDSVELPNGNGDESGDSVGVVTMWAPPDLFAQLGLTTETLRQVQADAAKASAAGEPYRLASTSKSGEWIGEAIAGAAGLDLDDKEEKKKVATILNAWIRSGALVVDREWLDIGRRRRPVIQVGVRA